MPTTVPFVPLPLDQGDVVYAHGPDSAQNPGVAPGTVEELLLETSPTFPGTSRRIWIHSPQGLDNRVECAVMFFNDGWWYLDPSGDVRGGTVLDNLAAAGDLPPMVSVFVDPGVVDLAGVTTPHRNIEYDAFDDAYANFLLGEVLPMIEARFTISADPMMRGICGGSSGGDAAFTAAWTRPDDIGRVIAFNASFAQMPGGNPIRRC